MYILKLLFLDVLSVIALIFMWKAVIKEAKKFIRGE